MIPTDSNFEAKVSMEKEAVPLPEAPPFHLLFLGDYSGRENFARTATAEPSDFTLHEIDRDNFDDVMKKLNVSLLLRISETDQNSIILTFRELDDFHPDRIFQQVHLFSELRETRKKLLNHDTFERTAREVYSWFDQTAPESGDDQPASDTSDVRGSGNLLDDILTDRKEEAVSYQSQTADIVSLRSFIQEIVKPHLIHTDEQEQAKLVRMVDQISTDLMRKILHHKDFKQLEAAWRGLNFVVQRVQTDRKLKLFLSDITKKEISDDLQSVSDLSNSGLFKVITQPNHPSSDGQTWALICGNYEFDVDVQDIATLIRLAKIGNIINASFISQIKPLMLGFDSFVSDPNFQSRTSAEDSPESKLWKTLRTLPESKNLGLILPKFLTRLPYGENTEPTENFFFEEFSHPSEHENYVWANSSFLVGLLIAQTFSLHGWEFKSRLLSDIENLPTHIFEDNDSFQTKPCAEIDMTHELCEIILNAGLMPVLSFRNTDVIKIADFISVSSPRKALTGRWD
jgi:type VI secretion system protein ImpC